MENITEEQKRKVYDLIAKNKIKKNYRIWHRFIYGTYGRVFGFCVQTGVYRAVLARWQYWRDGTILAYFSFG